MAEVAALMACGRDTRRKLGWSSYGSHLLRECCCFNAEIGACQATDTINRGHWTTVMPTG